MCSPAAVCLQFIEDVARVFDIPAAYNVPGPGGVFLGSVGDQSHATHRSSHNCAPMQESPVNGVAYVPDRAHACDYRPATKAIGERLAAAALADPRCRYVIYDGVGRKPNGERWSTYHPTWHISFLPGTHDDVRPFFNHPSKEPFTMDQFDEIMARLPGVKQQQRDRDRAKATAALTRANNDMLEELIDAQAQERRVDLQTLRAAREARDAATRTLDALDQEDDDEREGEG